MNDRELIQQLAQRVEELERRLNESARRDGDGPQTSRTVIGRAIGGVPGRTEISATEFDVQHKKVEIWDLSPQADPDDPWKFKQLLPEEYGDFGNIWHADVQAFVPLVLHRLPNGLYVNGSEECIQQ